MAINKTVFKTRALTAIVFAIVVLAGLLWNYWSILILFTTLHLGCWLEYLSLVEKIHREKFPYYFKASLICGAFAVALSFFFFFYVINGLEVFNFLVPVTGLASFFFLVYSFIKLKSRIFSKAFFAALAGVAYISVPIGLLIWLLFLGTIARSGDCSMVLGNFLILFIFISIWVNDTMAYITGSLFGKTPLTKISPKKTREGTAGGIILCIIVMFLVGNYIYPFKYVGANHWIIISALCAIAGTFGDLLESKLKRMAGIKDSGNFMPGHGGFLDRFDSLLVAVPFVWLYIKFIASYYPVS